MFVETPIDFFEAAAGPELHPSNASPILVGKTGDSLIWSSNPHLVQVGPFQSQPPTNILGRCHSLSVFLASLGFVLAMIGIGCFAWGRHPTSVSIFCTVWIGVSAVLGVCILFIPDIEWRSRRTRVRIGRLKVSV